MLVVRFAMNSQQRLHTLHIYRQILKLAARFPSIKRNKIVLEIRRSFRENKNLTDRKEIAKAMAVAEKGIEQLGAYSNLKRSNLDWSVDLEKNPMPKQEK